MVRLFSFDRFEALRSSKGITKKYIADALDRKPTICQDWKNGKSAPNKEQLQVVADILGTTPEYLSGETDDKNPPVFQNESGRKEVPTDTMAQITETARRLQPIQQEFFLALLKAAVQNLQEEAPQSQRLWTISQAAVAAGNAATNANIHP